jgi:hypothetical protein
VAHETVRGKWNVPAKDQGLSRNVCPSSLYAVTSSVRSSLTVVGICRIDDVRGRACPHSDVEGALLLFGSRHRRGVARMSFFLSRTRFAMSSTLTSLRRSWTTRRSEPGSRGRPSRMIAPRSTRSISLVAFRSSPLRRLVILYYSPNVKYNLPLSKYQLP